MANTKILVVDDEPDSITFVETILKKEGFTVLSASDGLEGFEKAILEYLPLSDPREIALRSAYL